MARVAKDTAFRGWVASSTAKVRAFLGWAIRVTVTPATTWSGPTGIGGTCKCQAISAGTCRLQAILEGEVRIYESVH
jgi:hypothetical protein